MPEEKLIYKILSGVAWDAAKASGVFDGAEIDHKDGYIHFSAADQVVETARKHFAGQAGLVLVAVSPDDLGDALKWEVSRGGALFPHLYDSLDLRHVAWARPLPLGPDGEHEFPDL